MRTIACLLALLLLAPATGCSRGERSTADQEGGARVERSVFGRTPDGRQVDLFTLTNAQGMEVRVITYGGIIVSLRVPDRTGELGDVVLGYDDLEGYLAESPYFGAIIGRYGNRIGGAAFELDGVRYELAANDGSNHLHGGIRGFDKVAWDAEAFRREQECGVVFSRTSPDGEEGYPGNLEVRVTYTLTDANELIFDYYAVTDRPTPVNLTQHTYFNLEGDGARDILDHELTLHADRFTPVDEGLIPTGELAPVDGTPFDFRVSRPVGLRIGADHPQIRRGGGYDHNFVLNREGEGMGGSDASGEGDPPGRTSAGGAAGKAAEPLMPAVRVFAPGTGRFMEVHTTEPGVQFYSGNFLDGSLTGKGGAVYHHRFGFCLETQHFPDSPNQPTFPSTILRLGQEYRSRTVYEFGVEEGG
jgi:aldose 1-epimerase